MHHPGEKRVNYFKATPGAESGGGRVNPGLHNLTLAAAVRL